MMYIIMVDAVLGQTRSLRLAGPRESGPSIPSNPEVRSIGPGASIIRFVDSDN